MERLRTVNDKEYNFYTQNKHIKNGISFYALHSLFNGYIVNRKKKEKQLSAIDRDNETMLK